MKLHVGCGNKRWPGYVNIDLHGTPDVVADISALPYDDGTVDEIASVHVLEHVWRDDMQLVLRHWLSKLRPGGRVVAELPCWDKVWGLIRCGEKSDQFTRWAMFGAPDTHKSVHDLHKWLWSVAEIKREFEKAGFSDVRSEEPQHKQPRRDMRIVGIK